MIRHLLTLSFLIVAVQFHALGQTVEEYKVFDAVILNMFSGKGNDVDTGKLPKLLVIKEGVYSGNDIGRYTGGEEPANEDETLKNLGISLETFIHFKTSNKAGGKLTKSFDPSLRYMIVSDHVIGSFFNRSAGINNIESGWEAYYKKYPNSGGFIGFSRVGFNKKMDEAIVYFQHSCGSLCASGYYLSLKKNSEHWKVASRRMLWIS